MAIDKATLSEQLLAVIEDFKSGGDYSASVQCEAVIHVSFLLEVEVEVEGSELELKDASGDSIRLVIEEVGDPVAEGDVEEAVRSAVDRKFLGYDADDVIRLANLDGYTELQDVEIDYIADIEEA